MLFDDNQGLCVSVIGFEYYSILKAGVICNIIIVCACAKLVEETRKSIFQKEKNESEKEFFSAWYAMSMCLPYN